MNFRKILQPLYWQYHNLRKDKKLNWILSELKKTQYLSPDKLEYLSWQKKKKLVTYAYENVPYYRRKYDSEGFHPRDLKEPEDYLNVPLLTREDVRDNLEDIVANNIGRDRFRVLGTGGSTGEPLKVYQDKNGDELRRVLYYCALGWSGIRPWSDHITVFRIQKQEDSRAKEVHRVTQTRGLNRIWKKAMYKLSYRWYRPRTFALDASCMDEESIMKCIREVERFKPKYIWGYVGGVAALASFIEKKGLIGLIQPKSVWVTSSPLSSNQRYYIQKIFGCEVYEQYGCVEIFWLAAECKAHEGLHVLSDVANVEFLDSNNKPTKPNISGRVVATDLENYSAPIIRYVNGDLGSMKKKLCSCGMTLPLINKIRGRQTDNLILPDGTCISGEYVTTIFDDFTEDVEKFQVHQVSMDELVIKVVMAKTLNYNNIINKVKKELMHKLKGQMKVEFRLVKEIQHDRGKYRYVISDVARRC